MRVLCVLMALFLLVAPSMTLADDEAQSAKEGFKGVHEGMKKITRAVDKKVKKGVKVVDNR